MKPSRILFSLVIVLFSFETASACSCSPIDFDDAAKNSDAIFIGRVVKLEQVRDVFPSKPYETSTSSYRQTRHVATLEVSKRWKGPKRDQMVIRQMSSSCEFPFQFQSEYLVFAFSENRFWLNPSTTYTTWLCSRTIDTRYFFLKQEEGWDWDDREALDALFP